MRESNNSPFKNMFRYSDANTYTDYETRAEAAAAKRAQGGGTIRIVSVPRFQRELPPLTLVERTIAIVDRHLAGEPEDERERRTR